MGGIFSGHQMVIMGDEESPSFTLLVEGLWQLTRIP